MDWKKYEEEIENHFRSEYPSARITRNARILGKLSNTLREIDLLIEAQVCDLPFRIVIDAKYHNRKIDVKDVEEFLGLVRDVGAHKALMISTEGYSEAAIQRAGADDADVILDVLNFEELEQFQAFGAIPHAGSHAALLPAPFEHRRRKAETARLPQPGHGRAVLILDDDSVRSRSGGGVYPRHLGIYRHRSALAYRRHLRGDRRGHARVLLDKRAI